MRAMVYRGPYKIRVEEKDIPRIEHPNDAIVRVTLGAICGSDLHLYHGMMPDTRVGMTFGHEFIGVVHEVGTSVQNLKFGDRVMVPFNDYCGSCFFCARGPRRVAAVVGGQPPVRGREPVSPDTFRT